jgi:hypothetical protein
MVPDMEPYLNFAMALMQGNDLNVSADKETLAPEDFSTVSSAFF